MLDNAKRLVRFSRYRNDEEIFSEYICSQLLKSAAEKGKGTIHLAGAIGSDKEQVLFGCDEHMMHRAAQRLGLCWAEVVLVHVIEACEKCEELGNALLDSEDLAYEKGYNYGMCALLIEDLDIFVYLHISNGQIFVATVMSFPKYYVNEDCELVARIDPQGNLHNGFKDNPRFEKSKEKKFKKRQ